MRRALGALKQRGPLTAGEVGREVFGGLRTAQGYARAAGGVLHALARRGLVRQEITKQGAGGVIWQAAT